MTPPAATAASGSGTPPALPAGRSGRRGAVLQHPRQGLRAAGIGARRTRGGRRTRGVAPAASGIGPSSDGGGQQRLASHGADRAAGPDADHSVNLPARVSGSRGKEDARRDAAAQRPTNSRRPPVRRALCTSPISSDGSPAERVLKPLDLAAGTVRGLDRQSAQVVSIPLSRISAVRPM